MPQAGSKVVFICTYPDPSVYMYKLTLFRTNFLSLKTDIKYISFLANLKESGSGYVTKQCRTVLLYIFYLEANQCCVLCRLCAAYRTA
jgi:hypothetical protein